MESLFKRHDAYLSSVPIRCANSCILTRALISSLCRWTNYWTIRQRTVCK